MGPLEVFIVMPFRVFTAVVSTLYHSWFRLRWTPSSKRWLISLDKKIRSTLTHSNNGEWVQVEHNQCVHRIWTVKIEGDKKGTVPVVMIHGMAGGGDMFINNIDELAKDRDIYVIDLPGFGLSSRPHLRTAEHDGWIREATVEDVESFYTEVFEKLFENLKLDKLILLGHSYGGYLASLYGLTYSQRIKHLILVDPWGYPQRPTSANNRPFMKNTALVLLSRLYSKMNVFTPIRILGPLGPSLFRSLRSDLGHKFHSHLQDRDLAPNYLYACNTSDYPSGEEGFFILSIPFGWAKKPLADRVIDWDPNLDVTFVYGARSWVDQSHGYQIKNHRLSSYVDIHVISGAGHHVYADRPVAFNGMVRLIGDAVDEGKKPNISHDYEKRLIAMQSLRRRNSCKSQAALCNDEAVLYRPRRLSSHELFDSQDSALNASDEQIILESPVSFSLDDSDSDIDVHDNTVKTKQKSPKAVSFSVDDEKSRTGSKIHFQADMNKN